MSSDTETVTPYTLANQFSRLIFSSIFPHDPENDEKQHGRRNDIPTELLIPRVETTAAVEIDDILVVIENAIYAELSLRTARDVIMNQPRTRLVRVVSKSAKSLKVKDVDLARGNWRTNLTEFGKVYDYTETRLMLSSANREIGRLGTATELRQKLLDHPRFAEWQAAYNAAHKMHEADEAQSRATREAEEARLAPIKAAVEGLNAALNLRKPLVAMSFRDEVSTTPEWLAENGFLNLQVYIAGLNALGTLTDERQVEALRHLDVIIAYAKGEK